MTITTMTEKRFFEWHEDDISVTLRNAGASYGGGSEVLVIYETDETMDLLEQRADSWDAVRKKRRGGAEDA